MPVLYGEGESFVLTDPGETKFPVSVLERTWIKILNSKYFLLSPNYIWCDDLYVDGALWPMELFGLFLMYSFSYYSSLFLLFGHAGNIWSKTKLWKKQIYYIVRSICILLNGQLRSAQKKSVMWKTAWAADYATGKWEDNFVANFLASLEHCQVWDDRQPTWKYSTLTTIEI